MLTRAFLTFWSTPEFLKDLMELVVMGEGRDCFALLTDIVYLKAGRAAEHHTLARHRRDENGAVGASAGLKMWLVEDPSPRPPTNSGRRSGLFSRPGATTAVSISMLAVSSSMRKTR